MSIGKAFGILKQTFSEWSEDNASMLAAALAYYAVFSIAPLLLILVALVGLAFGQQAAQGQIYGQLRGVVGPDAAQLLQGAVAKSQKSGGIISIVIGVGTLLWSASSLFAQLQGSLNIIWNVQAAPGAGIIGTAKKRALSLLMVFGIAVLLLASLLLSTALAAVSNFFGDSLPGAGVIFQVINYVVALVIMTILFAAIYKVLPDVDISWGDVAIGAVATAALFVLGEILISLYLGYASVGSTYGAAGSLLVLLVWIYYSAMVLFFGAEFTQVYARQFGTKIAPSDGAIALTADVRAKQGHPSKAAVHYAARTGRPASTYGTSGKPQQAVAGHSVARQALDGHDELKASLWRGLTSGTRTFARVAALEGSAALWRAVMGEHPPTKKVR